MAIKKGVTKYGKNPKEKKINPVDKTVGWERLIRGQRLPSNFYYDPKKKK